MKMDRSELSVSRCFLDHRLVLSDRSEVENMIQTVCLRRIVVVLKSRSCCLLSYGKNCHERTFSLCLQMQETC